MSSSDGRMIAGVDGCKSGWVAVVENGRRDPWLEVYPTFAALLQSPVDIIVIDVPIGIMTDAPRAADRTARDLLRERACCVFSAPYRPMLRATSHSEACAIREAIDGKRCSRQSFAIIAKIVDVDAVMTPVLQDRVFEGHPEVTFAVMRGGQPVQHGKKSQQGWVARLNALRADFPDIDARAAIRRPAGVRRDDLLDAYAMLLTARRVALKSARRIPELSVPQLDDVGLRAEIYA